MSKTIHLVYVPFTGLGRYNGFRGNDWLKNRIQIFKQFVIPSLQAQTSKDFVLWLSWRPEEKGNPLVMGLENYILEHTNFRLECTYNGVCFWDDKYSDEEASERLLTSLHHSLKTLTDTVGEYDTVLLTIQPSDDCYSRDAFQILRSTLEGQYVDAAGFLKGYVCRYRTKEIAEYNPETTPPFFTIKFPKETFLDPWKHYKHTGPYKSHEYIGDKLRFVGIDYRGFLVGTHGENISTTFDIPYKGADEPVARFADFGLENVPPLEIKTNLRRRIMSKLPYAIRRKLRYWCGEKWPLLKWIVQ